MILLKLSLFIVLFWPICNLFGQLFAGAGSQISSGIRHFLGLAVVASFISICFTNGRTILLPITILFLYRLVAERKRLKSLSLVSIVKESIPLIVFSLVLCLCFFPLMLQLQNQKVLTGDYLFYGKLAEYMVSVGTETKDLNYFSNPAGTQVYHYLDLWLIGGITKLLNVTATQSVIFSYYSLFLALLFAVISDFIRLFTSGIKVWGFTIVFGTCMIFLSGSTYLMTFLLGSNEYGDNNGFFFPKLLFVSILIFALVFAVWKKESKLIASLLMIGILAYATLIPSLAGFALVYFWLEYKWTLFKWIHLKLLLVICITLFFFVGFYYLNPSGIEANNLYPVQLDYSNLLTRIHITGKAVLFMFLGILPLVFLYFFVRKNEHIARFRRLITILYSACFAGLVCWALLFNITDSLQLWNNFYFPLVGVIYIVFAIVFLMNFRFLLLLPFLLIDAIFPLQKLKFLDHTNTLPGSVSFLKNKRVGFLNYYNPDFNVFSKNDVVYFGDMFAVMNYVNCRIISLSSPEIEVIDGQYENVVKGSNLYSISKFDISGEMDVKEYQKKMIGNLELDYIFIHKERNTEFGLDENWTKIKSPEPAYRLFKRNSSE